MVNKPVIFLRLYSIVKYKIVKHTKVLENLGGNSTTALARKFLKINPIAKFYP